MLYPGLGTKCGHFDMKLGEQILNSISTMGGESNVETQKQGPGNHTKSEGT
jgi:hypothetical protein